MGPIVTIGFLLRILNATPFFSSHRAKSVATVLHGRKVNMPKEILSKDQIKKIARAISMDGESLPEREATLAAASPEIQRLVKRIWKLKLRGEGLLKAEERAENSTKKR